MNKDRSLFLLLGTSAILMCLSLFLPAIHNLPGFGVLVMGMIYGWIFPPSWAVYANVFYLGAIIRYKHHPVVLTTIMVCLALLTPLNAGSTPFGSISKWGWGAVLWLIAILLLALAVFLQPKNLTRKTEALILAGALSLTLLPVCYIHVKQTNLASDLEKEKYLPFGTAFTTKPLTGLEKKSPPRNLDFKIDDNDVIEIIGNLNHDRTKVRDGDFSIEIPHAFQISGKFIQVFKDKKLYPITLFSPAKPVDYYYGIKKLEENLAEIFILDKDKNSIWKGEVKYIKNEKKSAYSRWGFKAKRLYPDYYYDLDSVILHNYSRQVLKYDSETESYSVNQRVLTEEKASGTCSFSIINKRFRPQLIKWNGQLIEIDGDYGELQNRAFCSENYTFLLTRRKVRRHKVIMHVLVFDKSTMRPIYGFKALGDDDDVSVRHLLTHSENFDSIQNIAFIPSQKNVEDPEASGKPARIKLHMENDETITLVREASF